MIKILQFAYLNCMINCRKLMAQEMLVCCMFADVGMTVREVWWMGGCLFSSDR